MRSQLNIHEAKSQMSKLVEQTQLGREFVIIKAGNFPPLPVACCPILRTRSVTARLPVSQPNSEMLIPLTDDATLVTYSDNVRLTE